MYFGPGQPAARCIRWRERNGLQMKDNDAYFFDPKFKKELFANPRGLAAGMWKISEEKIKAGHRYYRFGDSNKPDSQNLSSPWWIDYETYKGIVLWGRTPEFRRLHGSPEAGHRIPEWQSATWS